MKFGTDRYRPAGIWVQTTIAVSVVGIQFRKEAARAYISAVQKAESLRLQYGLLLERQTNNPHDPDAIAIYGVSEVQASLNTSVQEWHIGYMARDLAAELAEDLVSKGVPIAAELLSIYESANGFIDVSYIVLAPKGYGHKARLRAKDS